MVLFGYNIKSDSWEFIVEIKNIQTVKLTDVHIKNLSVLYPEYSDFYLIGW